jgi:hypothetical protein
MINIMKAKYVEMIRKELIKNGVAEDFKVNPATNVVTIKTSLDKRKASMIATQAMMSMSTNRFGNVKVEVIKSDLPRLKRG